MTPLWIAWIIVAVALIATCVLKGKYVTAVAGVVAPLWFWPLGAIRLAKPKSLWARRFYDEAKMARASQRQARWQARRWNRSV